MMEPSTLPNYDLTTRRGQDEAMQRLEQAYLDFVMSAWSHGPWSRMHMINQRAPDQRAELREKQAHQRKLHEFCRRVVYWQKAKGRPVVVEQPVGAASWKEPLNESAFQDC